jgi:hypothetical protein
MRKILGFLLALMVNFSLSAGFVDDVLESAKNNPGLSAALGVAASVGLYKAYNYYSKRRAPASIDVLGGIKGDLNELLSPRVKGGNGFVIAPSMPKVTSVEHQSDFQDLRLPQVTWQGFNARLEKVFEIFKKQYLAGQWLDGVDPGALLTDEFLKGRGNFNSFVQKITVPVGSEVAMFGDLHGQFYSVIRSLNKLVDLGYLDASYRIIKDDFYIFFLGDFVDRGEHGVEVLNLLMQLKIQNPDRVYFSRGNHEDVNQNFVGGFMDQFKNKFVSSDPINLLSPKEQKVAFAKVDLIAKLYNLMPVAIYLDSGDAKVMCCHGGLEMGYNANKFLNSGTDFEFIKSFDRQDFVENLSDSLSVEFSDMDAYADDSPLKKEFSRRVINDRLKNMNPIANECGHMWSDFSDWGENETTYTVNRSFKYGKNLTDKIMADHGLDMIVRAHQHNGEMFNRLESGNGIASNWNNKVLTLFSAGDLFGDEGITKFDSFVIVKTAQNFEDWQIEHIYQPIE